MHYQWTERMHLKSIAKIRVKDTTASRFSRKMHMLLLKYLKLEVSTLFTRYIISLNSTNWQCLPVSPSRQFNNTQRQREAFQFLKVCVMACVRKPSVVIFGQCDWYPLLLTLLWGLSVLTDKGRNGFELTCLAWLYFPQIHIIWLMT